MQAGSLLELTVGGKQPIALPAGEQRTFLEDGDRVILRGWCERAGYARIGFGEATGAVLPATPLQASIDTLAIVKTFRYYDLILGAYVCVLLCANLIGPAKVSTVEVPLLGPVTFLAGVLFFPISYLFGDILTEVYGYCTIPGAWWRGGFAALVFAAIMAAVVVHLPPADFWRGKQAAVEEIFGNTPRIICAPPLSPLGVVRSSTATCWPR